MTVPTLGRHAALAAAATIIGVALAFVGLPYGRLTPDLFAERYHDGADTTGFIHLALDCNPALADTQDHCTYDTTAATAITVDVTLGNSTGTTVKPSAFTFSVINPDQSQLDAPAIDNPGYLDDNPDFSQSTVSGSWDCGPPAPSDDATAGGPEDSFLSCFDSLIDGPDMMSGEGHLKLASVRYTVVGIGARVELSLADVSVLDDSFVEIASCNPILDTAGLCFGATIDLVNGPGCYLDHDCDSYLDVMPPGHVGPVNLDHNYDNCPVAFPSHQQNYDGNFIDQSPPYVVDDGTRANSDAPGDECDPDADNDGRSALGFGIEAPCNGSGTLNPLNEDTDDDRVLDGAECALGSNPTDPLSKPAPPAPGTDSDGDSLSDGFEATIGTNPSAKDSDGDGLQDGWEYKGYNTNPLLTETDGDGIRDGCEVASLNTDTVVNVGDQAILSAELSRAVPPSQKLANMDLNKDGAINPGDQAFQASMMAPGKCP